MARVNPDAWPNDLELVDACRSGQADAFGGLVERYQGRVYNTVYRMIGAEEDARDVVQDAFIKAYENLDRFRGASSFYTWLYRIAMNLALSHRRKTKRLKLVRTAGDVDEVPLSGSQAARLADPPPGAAMERRETEGEITRALDELDPDHRAAIVLRDIEGLDYAAIAAILEVPAGTVKSRIHRGRMVLRDRLQDLLEA